MRTKGFALIMAIVATGVLAIVGSIAFVFPARPSASFSDEMILQRTKELPEVQTYLAKYPNATAFVNRGSDIHVSHGITKSELEGKPMNRTTGAGGQLIYESFLWLNVELDDGTLDPWHISLVCQGGEAIFNPSTNEYERRHFFQIDNSEILPYLTEGKEEICFS